MKIICYCTNCNKQFTKYPNDINENGNNFCSKSCSAKYNNRKYPKRQKEFKTKSCKFCNQIFLSNRGRNICDSCKENYSIKRLTISDYTKRNSVKGKHPSWKFSGIRCAARLQHKKLLQQPCAKCGFSEHVELCHIKPISSFDDTATIEEVNHPSNVIQLCPNCHWLFDNGKLTI